MKKFLKNIAILSSGIYSKPDIDPDLYYLQSTDFLNGEIFNLATKPQLKSKKINTKHLLQEGDLLFAAKGIKNFAAVYKTSIGNAVASSSFIVIKIKDEYKISIVPDYLAWYINHTKKIHLMHQQQLGSTIPSLSIKQVENLKIDIPDLHTQDLIVRIQKLKDRQKELVKKLEEKKDILFQNQLIKLTNGK